MKILLALFLAVIAASAFAQDASVAVSGTVGPAMVSSTSVTCTPVATTLTFPVAAYTPICPILVSPSTWIGGVSLSDATHYALGLNNGALYLMSGATSPAAGAFSVTITTTP
jgi:hypothetical protein